MRHVELMIQSLSKALFDKDPWYKMGEPEIKLFDDIPAALAWLGERYAGKKKDNMMMQDLHVGYVYRFRNADLSHFPVTEWDQRDWCSLRWATYEDIDLGGENEKKASTG